MAYDKKEQKAKGVKGIAANGELETLEANETNKDQFIRVDRHGNFFTNFGKELHVPVQPSDTLCAVPDGREDPGGGSQA